MIERTLADKTRDFWGMTPDEVDAEHIQKPVGTLNIKVVRWKTLPKAAYRELNEDYPESTGSLEQFEHKCFVHGAPVQLQAMNKPVWCDHPRGEKYVVDPDASDRVEQFMALWVK